MEIEETVVMEDYDNECHEVTDRIEENENNTFDVEVNTYQYPKLFTTKALLELSTSSWSQASKSKVDIQPYLRGCKWSPDGTCCLTVVNNDGVHVTELPRDLYTGPVMPNRPVDVLDSIIHVKEAGLIYDFCWYPGMNSSLPETCCWLTTRQNGPIQMWDAFDGSLRCSYRGFNAVDEMEPALSITFTSNANKIIAGYKKVIRTFDVQRPGREYTEHKISSPASCLATSDNLLAVGSWNNSISLYNINEMGTYKSIGKMYAHERGVTHLKFAPDGLKLVSGARKDHRLLVWDVRYYNRPLHILSRHAETNQRIYFDISPCGKYLVSGGTNGIVKVWILDKCDDIPPYKYPVHNDCCNSISIHPCRPILASGSGQYHFKDPVSSTEENDELSNENDKQHTEDISDTKHDKEDNEFKKKIKETCDMKYASESENCLGFWWVGDIDLDLRSSLLNNS